jgi:hypothetical protein
MRFIALKAVQGANDFQPVMKGHLGSSLQFRAAAELDLIGCVMISGWLVYPIYTTIFFDVKKTPAASHSVYAGFHGNQRQGAPGNSYQMVILASSFGHPHYVRLSLKIGCSSIHSACLHTTETEPPLLVARFLFGHQS